MKKIFTILFFFALPVFSQITTTKIAEKKDPKVEFPYDSTDNFLGRDARKYIGQELYLKPKSEALRKYGYSEFLIDYTKPDYGTSNHYKSPKGISNYDSLAGKYFKVLEVIPHPEATRNEYLYGDELYLKLVQKETNDTSFFKYSTKYEHSFPFICVGYFNKIKADRKNKSYILSKNRIDGSIDITTGDTIKFKINDVWKFSDITIEEEYYNLIAILENQAGEKYSNNYEYLFGKDPWNGIFDLKEATTYKSKFGADNWERILHGTVKVGMTREMCELSWGKPEKINETITGKSIREQWVYDDNYLYFVNGKLTTIQ